MLDFLALAQQCAPTVASQTMAAVVNVESRYNPYAIGVVGGHLARQPRNLNEAVATAQALQNAGWNFSVGVSQVNRYNLPKHGLSYGQAFEPCSNLRAGSKSSKSAIRAPVRASTTSSRHYVLPSLATTAATSRADFSPTRPASQATSRRS